jgi:transmembrane sensor
MSKKDFSILLEKYVAGTLNAYEKEELVRLLHSPHEEEELKALIDEKFEGISFREKPSPEISAIIFSRIMEAKNREDESDTAIVNMPVRRNKRWMYAAAVILVLGTGVFFILNSNSKSGIDSVNTNVKTIVVTPPAVAKASIILANGKVITLDSLNNGTMASQGNADVIKLAEGEIVYKAQKDKEDSHEIVYNTLKVPRGSKVVTITLSDGTKVWLNAASSLKYPTVFAGVLRQVEVTGEVYFEVATILAKTVKGNQKIPFSVKVNNKAVVEVLGTHFNVHAYEEDTLAITLLEGAVKVTGDNNSSMLKPGQQVQVKNNGNISLQNDIDLEQVMAWKNGYFQFDGSGINEVMGQIARWYDVDVKYEGNVISQHFRGTISRNVDAAKVFKMLEATDAVHFRSEGKNIIVTP